MQPVQNISKFLETFDKSNKLDLKTFELFKESAEDPKSLYELIEMLRNSGVNKNNLDFLLGQAEASEDTETSIDFENKGEVESKFQNYFNTKDKVLEEDFFDQEQVKRLKFVESESSEDLLEIPGLGFAPTREEIITSVPVAEKQKLPADTVFFRHVLPDFKLKMEIDLCIDADPSFLFPELQCKLCGLRFGAEHSQEFGLHIDDHRRFTNALGEKLLLRREFFSSKVVNKIEKLELTVEGAEEIVWDAESPSCCICEKTIKKIWSDKIENWVLEEGTRVSENEVAHRKCVD